MTERPENSFYDHTPWRRLVRRYADGRKQCNCGDAYVDTHDICRYGCSANLAITKDEIAKKIEDEALTRQLEQDLL